jgi:RNA-binding motif protein, X-linked 2
MRDFLLAQFKEEKKNKSAKKAKRLDETPEERRARKERKRQKKELKERERRGVRDDRRHGSPRREERGGRGWDDRHAPSRLRSSSSERQAKRARVGGGSS